MDELLDSTLCCEYEGLDDKETIARLKREVSFIVASYRTEFVY